MSEVAPQELVLRFLASIGRPDEAAKYLEQFRADAGAFAMLHVSHAVLRDASDALVVDLRFLAELGLRPVIVVGAERARNADTWAQRLVDDLDLPSVVVPPDADAITRALRDGQLPVVAITAPEGDARAQEDPRFDVIAQLATALGTRRIVFMGRRSGLQPTDGRVVPLLDLTTERNAFVLPRPQAELLRQIGRIVDAVPQRLTVSVTSPLDLMRELFTVKGAGTLVRRGSIVTRHDRGEGVDPARLTALIEEAFGKKLDPAFAARPARTIYVADEYRGAAIVTDTTLAPYLSKFAVTLEARGEGVGRDLWRVLVADVPRLYWRSRADNPITAWYRDQCDGLHRLEAHGVAWVVLWRGLAAAEIPDAIALAASAAPDFA